MQLTRGEDKEKGRENEMKRKKTRRWKGTGRDWRRWERREAWKKGEERARTNLWCLWGPRTHAY